MILPFFVYQGVPFIRLFHELQENEVDPVCAIDWSTLLEAAADEVCGALLSCMTGVSWLVMGFTPPPLLLPNCDIFLTCRFFVGVAVASSISVAFFHFETIVLLIEKESINKRSSHALQASFMKHDDTALMAAAEAGDLTDILGDLLSGRYGYPIEWFLFPFQPCQFSSRLF